MSLKSRLARVALARHRRYCARLAEMLAPKPGDEALPYKDASLPVEERVADLLSRLTLEEKIDQMSMPEARSAVAVGAALIVMPVASRVNKRLGIPPFLPTGSSRGANLFTTAFPVSMARGASWDVELERRVHAAIGAETKAIGANILYSPTINLVRHPGGGRSQESYGEDPHHVGRLAVAAVQGVQQHVMAQVKHFACNNIEQDRFHIDVRIDERTLRELYLPHFHAAIIEGGAASVMSAYNKVNGQYCGEHHHLLRKILKTEWGFDGFVMSDWIFGTRSTVDAANNGLDMEMPAPIFYGKKLLKAARAGEVSQDAIDDAVARMLRKKFEFGLFENPPLVDFGRIEAPEHRALAREAAAASIVLLRNEENLLPLDLSTKRRIAVIGPQANRVRAGDLGSSSVWAEGGVSPYEGIRRAARGMRVDLCTARSPKAAAMCAARADVAVVVAALSVRDEGEWLDKRLPIGGDRPDLSLGKGDIARIHAVAKACEKVIVLIESGSTVTVEEWIYDVDAVLMAWYPGLEGGSAIADVLFGDVNPSGKLPVTLPHHVRELPPLGSGEQSITYDLYHGYRHLQARRARPRYPFGFGLSYTSFDYTGLKLSASKLTEGESLEVRFTLTNTGARAGAEVAQLYLATHGSKVERVVRELKGFSKEHLQPGESREVVLEVPWKELAYWDVDSGGWRVEPIQYEIQVGSSCEELPLRAAFVLEG